MPYLHTIRNTGSGEKLAAPGGLLRGGRDPIGGREDDGPEIRCGAVKFEGNIVELQALLFDANDAAAHLHLVLGIIQEEGLSDVEMGTHEEEAAVSVDDLCLGLLLELLTFLVFGKHSDVDAQNNALTPPSIGGVGHGVRMVPPLYALWGKGQLVFQTGFSQVEGKQEFSGKHAAVDGLWYDRFLQI